MISLRNKAAPVGAALALCAVISASAQEPGHAATEEVVVFGTPGGQPTNELAQSVTVLAGEELDRVRAANLGETLAGQLGISSTFFGAGSSRPIIRGLAGPRVRMMEDGIDSLDVSTVSVDHAVSIDPLAAEQIEIFRGPTTLLYGSGAVGGVINTVTNRIPDSAPVDAFSGAVEIRGDTAADDQALSFALDGGGELLAWHLDALTRATDDYEIPGFAELGPDDGQDGGDGEERGRVLENSDLEIDSIAGGLSWLGESAFFGISVSLFDTNYGLPGSHAHEAESGPAAEEEFVRIDLNQVRYDLKGGWLDLGGIVERIDLRFGANDYQHVELEGAEVGTRFDNDAYEGRVEILHRPVGLWEGAFGLQISHREFSAIGDEAFVPPTDTTSYGVFLIEKREFDRWQLSLGARFENQEHEPAASALAVDDSAVSLSFAAIRDLGSGYSIALNLADAERLPSVDELYSNGPHLATGNVEIGNASLTAETSRHFDLSVRKSEGEMTWTVTAFVTDYTDYIFLRDTGLIDPDENLPVFEFTQADAEFFGLEAEFFRPIAKVGDGEIDIRLFGDFVRAELTSGENLPRIPPRRFGARLQYHDARWVAGIETTRYDGQDETAPNERPTPGYTMLNADFQWTVRETTSSVLDIFFRGTNLLDRDARRHSSFLKETTPLPGRNYSVGVRASF